MLTQLQRRTVAAIVNVFETSSVVGHYSAVTFSASDAGHVSYGRAQASLASGNLGKLLQQYVGVAAAPFERALGPYVQAAIARDNKLDRDGYFQNLLRAAADDKAMRDTQDAFFDQNFLEKAVRAAEEAGLTTALGAALAYDAFIQGGWERVCNRTDSAVGPIAKAGEPEWIRGYIAQRRAWLISLDSLASQTVYRMDAFQRLVELDQWDLALPLVVRTLEISDQTLNAFPADCYDGSHPVGSRDLSLAQGAPVPRGLDVRRLQLGLSADKTLSVVADGVFGRGTQSAITAYQQAHGLSANGVASASLVVSIAQPK
jgi:chitosanase